MLRFGLLMYVCLFFLGCALLFAFVSAGSPCFDSLNIFFLMRVEYFLLML